MPQARDTLAAAQTALNSANSALQPDSSLLQSTDDAMRELTRVLRRPSARSRTTSIDAPEALIRGKLEDKK